MKILSKILYGIDLNQEADHYMDKVILFAKRMKSTIIPMYVIKKNPNVEDIQNFLVNAVREKLNEIRDEFMRNGVKCEDPVLCIGDPAYEIVREAKNLNVNLIMLGHRSAHTKKNFSHLIQKVINKTNIPVFVLNETEHWFLREVLCPIDFSASSKRALKNAIVLCKKFKAKLTVLNIYETTHPYYFINDHVSNFDLTYDEERNYRNFQDYLKKIDFKGIEWTMLRKTGFPDVEILKTLEEGKFDMLLIGSTGRSNFNKFFMGSTTEKVLRECTIPFITTKSKNLIRFEVEAKINDLESHYKEATEFERLGFYDKAIKEYKNCLEIDNLHLRSYYSLAEIYDRKKEPKKAIKYRKIAREIYNHMWDEKIERDVRANYTLVDHHIHN